MPGSESYHAHPVVKYVDVMIKSILAVNLQLSPFVPTHPSPGSEYHGMMVDGMQMLK